LRPNAPKLDNFRSQGYDLHEVAIAKLTSDRSKNTGTARALVFLHDYSCVLVERNIGTVFPACTANGTNDNRLNDVTLLNNATWCCFFDGTYDQITDVRRFTTRAAQDADTHQFLRPR